MTDIAELRELVLRRGEMQLEINSLSERISDLRREVSRLDFVKLPEMFCSLGVTRLDIEPDGNVPSFAAVLEPYYKAVVQAGWTESQREAAFELLERLGLGSIIRWQITITMGSNQKQETQELSDMLSSLNVPHTVSREVPWTTLKTAIREIRENSREFGDSELRILGATIGKIVKKK